MNREQGVTVAKKASISKAALHNAQYQCEIDSDHKTFVTSRNLPYMEGHHLIPCTYTNSQHFWTKYNRNIDCVENIVCLCPICHRQVHFGSDSEKRDILSKLYAKRINDLQSIGIKITLEELEKLYGL